MFESEEKIIFEKSMKFNLNYFMKLDLSKEKSIKALDKFCEIIFNIEENKEIFYLTKKKDKSYDLTFRFTEENKINKLYNEFLSHTHLITEFIQGFDDTPEYEKRFLTYWQLTQNLSPKQKHIKNKI